LLYKAERARVYLGSNIVAIPAILPRHYQKCVHSPSIHRVNRTALRKTSNDYKCDSGKFFSAEEKVTTYVSIYFVACDGRHIPWLFAVNIQNKCIPINFKVLGL
jgi:hypothetical protein